MRAHIGATLEERPSTDMSPWQYAIARLKELAETGEPFVLVCPKPLPSELDTLELHTVSNLPFDLQYEVLSAVNQSLREVLDK